MFRQLYNHSTSLRLILYLLFPGRPVKQETCEAEKSVSRGKDWQWEDQDHQNGLPGQGVIVSCVEEEAVVKWNGGNTNKYRIGSSGAFDLIYIGNGEWNET